MTELKPVDRDNLDAVLKLKVTENQQRFVAPNILSMAQAAVEPEAVPLAIYADGEAVGFVMHTLDADTGEWWLWRLMVDARHQGKGHARRALELLIAEVKGGPLRCMNTSVVPGNPGAEGLYQSLGFVFTGEVDEDGEKHMALAW